VIGLTSTAFVLTLPPLHAGNHGSCRNKKSHYSAAVLSSLWAKLVTKWWWHLLST